MRRRVGSILAVGLVSLSLVACGGRERSASLPETPSLGEPVPLPDEPRRQFDFWLGEWKVQNLHLREGTWKESGEARARIQPVVDGAAVLEQWEGSVGGNPLHGFSLRAYDPRLKRWRVYLNWHGGRPGGFSMMLARRNGERMELFPPDDETQLRYSFSQAHEDSCQWDSAQSEDGETWTTDWIMQFKRVGPPEPVDAGNALVQRPPSAAAEFSKTRELDFLIGTWTGTARSLGADGEWQQGTATARISSMIEGFGLLQFLDTSWGEKTLCALGYDSDETEWISLRVDNRNEGVTRMEGLPEVETRSVTFTASGDGGVRESWSCPGGRTCDWRRQIRDPGGASWRSVLEIHFERPGATGPPVAG